MSRGVRFERPKARQKDEPLQPTILVNGSPHIKCIGCDKLVRIFDEAYDIGVVEGQKASQPSRYIKPGTRADNPAPWWIGQRVYDVIKHGKGCIDCYSAWQRYQRGR